MHILHLVHQYLPEKIGGTELYTRTLAHHQVKQGHEVTIVTPASTPIITPEPVVEEGVTVYRIGVGPRGATAVFRSTFRHSQLDRTLAYILRQEQPNVVHIQHLMGWPSQLVRHIQQANIPYLITLHDYWHLCANAQLITNYDHTVCRGPNWWVNCARCALARAGYKQATPLIPGLMSLLGWRHNRLQKVLSGARTLIAPTLFTAQIHEQMGISLTGIQIVPHGIALPKVMPPRQPRSHRLRIGYIGGLSWQKGVHILVEAVNQLPKTEVTLTIYGDTAVFPDYTAQLKQQAQHPGIHLAGRIPHHHLWSALAQLDVVVVPSLWYETASLIIQEAFAAQVPVIASNLGALRERVADGIDGVLVPAGDVFALYQILDQCRRDPAYLNQLQAGIQPVFTIQEHLMKMEAIYRQIVV